MYLPQVWAEDWERRREAGVPESVGFRTKPQLAQLMLKRALESGVPFGWVAGDEVYGNDRKLRLWLEREGIPHVLAIRSNEKLWVWTDKGLCQVRADRLTSQVDELGWTRCSAGDGAKGQVGLDQYEVRRWDGWYRHITLAMLAQAYLSVIKHQAMEPGEKGAATVPMKR